LNFTYVTDEKLKEKLVHKGFKLLQKSDNSSQQIWIFENIPPTEFSDYDKSKHINTNKMMF
jgi:hypothetical protein